MVCSEKFRLQIHLGRCTGVHPFKCPKCNFHFGSRQSKHTHIKKNSCKQFIELSPLPVIELPERPNFAHLPARIRIIEIPPQTTPPQPPTPPPPAPVIPEPPKANPKTTKAKMTIPKTLRIAVWDKHIGMDVGRAKCLCCKTITISQMEFECGHIEPESKGGPTDVDNLLPVCGACNRSMFTMNLYEFRDKHFKTLHGEKNEQLGEFPYKPTLEPQKSPLTL